MAATSILVRKMTINKSGIGNAEDKVNKIKNKTLGTFCDVQNVKTSFSWKRTRDWAFDEYSIYFSFSL